MVQDVDSQQKAIVHNFEAFQHLSKKKDQEAGQLKWLVSLICTESERSRYADTQVLHCSQGMADKGKIKIKTFEVIIRSLQ